MPNVLITGGSGLIGSALTKLLLKQGYSVTILTRKIPRNTSGIQYAKWDIEQEYIDMEAISAADYVIHLAGSGVADQRWTPKRKKEIVESRTKTGELLSKSIKSFGTKVKAVISASAIGWYGADPEIPNTAPFKENDPVANDFLGTTSRAWEASIQPVSNAGKRLVIIRTGIVLAKEGGALKEFMKPVKLGLASILGSGNQVISWIHIADLCRMYLMAIEDESMSGVFNAVAPSPVSNKELNLELAQAVKGKFFLPVHVPTFALKLALGEMSVEILKSATVSSSKIQQQGFQFMFPSIEAAVRDLVKE